MNKFGNCPLAEEKKITRLVDVGELEADLENLPTVDPESLRGHAKWVKSAEKVVIVTDGPDDCHKEPAIVCSNCDATMSQPEFDMWVWNYCPVCGFIMEDTTNGQ